jgi:hypothetical protein
MQYTIDDNKLTIGDLIKLQTANNDIATMVSILRKCVEVENGEFEDVPAKHFPVIVKTIMASLNPPMGNLRRR